MVSKLLSLGSNIGGKDKEGRLGLHWAAEKGHAEAVGVLVRDMLQANLDIQATVSSQNCLALATLPSGCNEQSPSWSMHRAGRKGQSFGAFERKLCMLCLCIYMCHLELVPVRVSV